MFWVAIESFRKSRRATLIEFSRMLGRSDHSYNNLRLRGNLIHKTCMEVLDSGIFTEAEVEAAKDSFNYDKTSSEDVREFKELLFCIGEDTLRSRESSSVFRIKNNPDFYKKLHALEDTTQFSMLREVEPNDPGIQELRRMIGEKVIWDNPPPVLEEAVHNVLMVADRRNEIDRDVRYSSIFSL